MDYSSNTRTKKIGTWQERAKMVDGGQRSWANTTIVIPRSPSLSERKSLIQDQMVVLQQKIQLIEYDHKAYQESTSYTIKENEETIRVLHQENKKLNKELVQEKQIQADREAKVKDGKDVLKLNENKLHDTIKHLNSLYHQTQVRRKCLEEMELMLKQNAGVKQDRSFREEQIQHFLENKLEEAKIKLQDVKHMRSVYRKITTILQDEMPTFHPQIEQLEAEILLFKKELKELKLMNHNVAISRDNAWAEYQNLKNEYRSIRIQKEQILRNLNHQANERRQFKKTKTKPGEIIEDQAPTDYEASLAEEMEVRVRSYEEATEKIKEATGAVNENEVVQRFLYQEEKLKHLEKEKLKAETTLLDIDYCCLAFFYQNKYCELIGFAVVLDGGQSDMKDTQEKTVNLLKETKYSKQVKLQAELSDNQKILEDLQERLQLESKNLNYFKKEFEKIREVLAKATSEVKRLQIKLQLNKISWGKFPPKDLSFNSPVLDLLAIIGQKMQNLQKLLEGHDAEEIFREMEEEDFVDIIERNLPASNLRISLLSPAKLDESDDEAGEEDCFQITRETIKKISERITISKRKANIWCKKWGLSSVTYA
ncbi:outer dynein arm-docking complex subunit 3-like [Ranitomeya imitator]|uniref:outer dynein arm-docking complex subunit 3-like n=1 Tax=Ranitomeya imitator TaxID=111125 RepID=UPI0037E759EC